MNGYDDCASHSSNYQVSKTRPSGVVDDAQYRRSSTPYRDGGSRYEDARLPKKGRNLIHGDLKENPPICKEGRELSLRQTRLPALKNVISRFGQRQMTNARIFAPVIPLSAKVV